MKVTINLPDEVLEQYEGYLKEGESLQEFFAARLEELKDLSPRDRCLLVTEKTRPELEEILGQLLQSEVELLNRVRLLASVEIGHVRLNPSPAQMKEMERRAKNNGRTFEEEADRVFKKMAQQFFNVG